MEVPGYAGLGGSGCYSNHIDLIRNEDDERHLKDAEEDLGTAATDEEAVEEATYELSKNQIENGEEEENGTSSYCHEEEKESDGEEDNNSEDEIIEELEEDMRMIDHDAED